MRIIATRTLREFWEKHRDAEQPMKAWLAKTRAASWKSPLDVKGHAATASLLGAGRVVFNIGGNKYRVVTSVRYDLAAVFIRFVGTHAEYDRIDAREV